jgi:hypothetical protein
MVKVEIVLDEEKVKKEGKYNLDEMYKAIDDLFLSYGADRCESENKGVAYCSQSGEKDLAVIGGAVSELEDEQWFVNSVTLWQWFIGNGENVVCEDILQEYRDSFGV